MTGSWGTIPGHGSDIEASDESYVPDVRGKVRWLTWETGMRALLMLALLMAMTGLCGCGERDATGGREGGRDILDPSEVTRPTMRVTEVVRALPRIDETGPSDVFQQEVRVAAGGGAPRQSD